MKLRHSKATETTLRDIYSELVFELRTEIEKYALKNGHLRPYQQTRAGELMELEREAIRIINAKYPSVRNEIFNFGRESYEQSYLFPFYEAYQRYGYSLLIPDSLESEALSALDSIISGRTLSQRLYNERDKLAARATKEIALGSMMGKSVPEVSQAISRHTGISYRNAVRIMRTESTRISGKATEKSITDLQERAGAYGIEVTKKWLSATDNRVRASHRELNGQFADEDGYFTSPSGAKAKHPGGFGIASEDINCRCTLVTEMAINGQSLKDIQKQYWEQYGGFEEWYRNNR